MKDTCTAICFYPITKQACVLSTLKKLAFENIVGKREDAGNQRFIIFFFPTMFSIRQKTRAVTKCDLIPPPALRQKLIFCTQKDRQTDT